MFRNIVLNIIKNKHDVNKPINALQMLPNEIKIKSYAQTATSTNSQFETDTVNIPLLTLHYHPYGKITKVHGIVSASSVLNKNIFIDMYVALRGVFGGETPQYEDLLNKGVVNAAHGLAEAAHQVGATHVIDVKIEKAVIITRFVIGTHVFVTAYGTAVNIKTD